MILNNGLYQEIGQQGQIYIFGAHSRARTLAEYFRCLYPEMTIGAYLYDDEEENPSHIGVTEVIRLKENAPLSEKLYAEAPVYIATRGICHPRIARHLRQLGFSRIYPVTVELDIQLRNEYMKKYFADMGRKFVKIHMLDVSGKDTMEADRLCKREEAAVYVAISAYDKLLNHPYSLAFYEKKIQVGAALTEKRFPDVLADDSEKDNISIRNRQFCELTALYWLWKHAKEEIIGLVHYRRHFMLPDDWMLRMQKNNVDIILPVPLCVAPNLAENYKGRHNPSDWDYMMDCLRRQDNQEYEAAKTFFRTSLYSPCNMLIARRDVLDKLCTWLFPILFAVAEHGGEKEDSYQNRYIGFLSERLITFFFERNRDKYRIVYADKNFLE